MGTTTKTKEVRKRLAVILVTVDTDLLTNDGENTEPEGWDVLKEQFEEHMNYSSHGVGSTVKTEFIEWEELES